MFRWWRKRRQRKILAEPLYPDWLQILAAAVPQSSEWNSTLQTKFANNTRIFMASKNWEGCNGLTVTTEMKIVIAAQASMMVLGIDDYCFEGVQTILIYPASFRRETQNGLVVSDSARIGEAWHRGPIVLSWIDVAHHTPGRNVVVHELAHHLDGLDGDISGNPILSNADAQARWEVVASAGYQCLRDDLANNRPTLLDPYAATNRAEYFAVACEYFFESPRELRSQLPELYECLTKLFNADPAGW